MLDQFYLFIQHFAFRKDEKAMSYKQEQVIRYCISNIPYIHFWKFSFVRTEQNEYEYDETMLGMCVAYTQKNEIDL